MICPSFEEVMELTRTVSSHTAFSENECRAYYDLSAALPPHSTIVEIGLQFGRSSSIVGQIAGPMLHDYFAIDPFIESPEAGPAWISLMQKISCPVTLMMTFSGLAELPENIALLLVDGDHTADGVEIDCGIARLFVRQGGHACFHDYGNPGLPGVQETVDRLMPGYGFELVSVADTLAIWRRK